MRLLRYEQMGRIHLGVLKGEHIVPLDALQPEFPSIQAIAAGGSPALVRVASHAETTASSVPLTKVRLLAPIERPGKYLAIGMNYRKHLKEAESIGVPAPKRQLWFNKQTTCIAAPFDKIEPGPTEQLDYE
ncbi:MAG TPA: Rv2993c-like domain-containing protein, partial [Steroidobacteraceae bacterium]